MARALEIIGIIAGGIVFVLVVGWASQGIAGDRMRQFRAGELPGEEWKDPDRPE